MLWILCIELGVSVPNLTGTLRPTAVYQLVAHCAMPSQSTHDEHAQNEVARVVSCTTDIGHSVHTLLGQGNEC